MKVSAWMMVAVLFATPLEAETIRTVTPNHPHTTCTNYNTADAPLICFDSAGNVIVNKPSDWRPIDTAPKDGRRIWVFGRTQDENGNVLTWQGVSYWNTILLGGKEPHWTGPAIWEPGWYRKVQNGENYEPRVLQPTHWRELPEDPK